MKISLILAFLAVAPAFAQEETPLRASVVVEGDSSAAAGEAVSRSMQFRVVGGDGAIRGTIAILAEQTKDELLRLTEETDDNWKVPVRLMLFGKPGDRSPQRNIAMELFSTEKAYDLRVKIHLGHGIERERLANAITTALVLERTLKTRKPSDNETPVQAPPWLIDGLREATAWRLHESDRRTYETLFKSGGVYKMDELFGMTEESRDNLDPATRLAFQVSSGALVMALLEQPQGREGFRAFLGDVAGYQGEMPSLLRKHFPELNLSETSLAKWWALQLANMGAAPLSDSLSIAETESTLEEILRLHFRSEAGFSMEKPLSAWQEVAALKDADRVAAVRPAQEGLVRLSYRSFPSYRSLLLDYQTLLTSLQQNKTTKIAAQLSTLDASRELMRAKADRARDFMDWFEITRARETSGAFDDYLRLKDGLEQQENQRTDSVSKYLDQMDDIFSRAQVKPKAPGGPPPLLLPQ